MSAEQSGYQRLRSHLHYLRLEAAAEALPASSSGPPSRSSAPSAFLERLLSIEVEATEQRRREGG